MNIKKQEVKTFIERAYCNDCGVELEMQPFVIDTYPPIYTYKCPKCGKIIESRETFPRTVHEPVIDERNVDNGIYTPECPINHMVDFPDELKYTDNSDSNVVRLGDVTVSKDVILNDNTIKC